MRREIAGLVYVMISVGRCIGSSRKDRVGETPRPARVKGGLRGWAVGNNYDRPMDLNV